MKKIKVFQHELFRLLIPRFNFNCKSCHLIRKTSLSHISSQTKIPFIPFLTSRVTLLTILPRTIKPFFIEKKYFMHDVFRECIKSNFKGFPLYTCISINKIQYIWISNRQYILNFILYYLIACSNKINERIELSLW